MTVADAPGGGRVPFRADFPDVVVQRPWGSAGRSSDHSDYRAAKAGDADAAYRLVRDFVASARVEDIRAMIGDRRPVIVAVHAEEAAGRNKLPVAYAAVLGHMLGLAVDADIVQANRPQRTGRSNLYRILHGAEFDGRVQPQQDYLIADDHVSQGGTLADLRSHIEKLRGRVVGATTLTAIPEGQILAPRPRTLAALRGKPPGIDDWWRTAHGQGLDGLTEHEARYLQRFNSLDSLRNQLAQGGQGAGTRPRQGPAGAGGGEPGRQGGGGVATAPAAGRRHYAA